MKKTNYSFLIISILVFISGHAIAGDNLHLKLMDKKEFEKLRPAVEQNIAEDAQENDRIFIFEDQTFKMMRNSKVLFKLFPVEYGSKKAVNGICVLEVFSKDNRLKQILPLHYEQGNTNEDEAEVIGSCQGVYAVTLHHWNNQKIIIYLISYRYGNHHGKSAFIGAIHSDRIEHLKKLSDCVSSMDNIGTLLKVKKALLQCSPTAIDRAEKENSHLKYYSDVDGFSMGITNDSRIAMDWYNRGIAHNALGNFREAISDYDKAIEIDPKNANTWSNRALAYSNLGDYKQAISDYDKAIEIDPKYPYFWYDRGAAYDQLGNYKQALSDYSKAIEIDPKYEQAWNNRGAAYDKLGYYRQAISDFDKAVQIDPKDAIAWYNRGIVYGKLDNYKQALSDYDKAIEINSQNAIYWCSRGAIYYELGNHRQAISDFDKAIEIDQKYITAWYNRGVAYDELGNYQQAISNYDKVIEIDPRYAEAWNNRGIAYGKLGNKKRAIQDLTIAAKLGEKLAQDNLRKNGINWEN